MKKGNKDRKEESEERETAIKYEVMEMVEGTDTELEKVQKGE